MPWSHSAGSVRPIFNGSFLSYLMNTLCAKFLSGVTGGRVLSVVCCLFATVAFAQPAPDPEPNGVSISIVGLGDLPGALRFQQGGKVMNAGIPAGGRGVSFHYKGPAPLVLFEELVDAAGKITRVPRATASYPAEWKKVLLVLLPGDTKDGMLRAFTFDDSREGFPPDHVRLFNFYFSAVAVSANGTIDQIEPGTSKLLALPARDSLGRIWMKLAALRGGHWEVLPTWITQSPSSARLLMFAYEQRNEGGALIPVYRTLTEVVPPEEAPANVVMR